MTDQPTNQPTGIAGAADYRPAQQTQTLPDTLTEKDGKVYLKAIVERDEEIARLRARIEEMDSIIDSCEHDKQFLSEQWHKSNDQLATERQRREQAEADCAAMKAQAYAYLETIIEEAESLPQEGGSEATIIEQAEAIRDLLSKPNPGQPLLDRLKALEAERDSAIDNLQATAQGYVRMEEALRDMLSGWCYIREVHGDLYGVGWDRAEKRARKALEANQ